MIHTLETLQHYDVPSVFTKGPAPTLSSKYVFVPTQEIVENFLNEGWTISSASQRGNSTFAKHTIRMKLQGTSQVGDTIPEIILTNSHDGKSGFSLATGLHRLVCSNGLTVPTSIAQKFTVRHMNFDLGEVRRVTDEFVERLPVIADSVKRLTERQLTFDEQCQYVDKAWNIKWLNPKLRNSSHENVLNPQREADQPMNMWTTFNVVQEKFIRGGVSYPSGSNQRSRVSRGLKDFDRVNKINTELWELAEEMC
jgi:hypothetical protein